MWIRDPKTGEKSVTLTAFITGFGVATLKLLLSGVALGSVSLSPFTGSDYALVVGAVGAIYWARKNTDSKSE
jgi:hypothetical protein